MQGIGTENAGIGPEVLKKMLSLVHSTWETITLLIQFAHVSCPPNHEEKNWEERGSY